MLPNILLVASQVLMLFLMIAVGWFCAARKILTKDGADQLSRISLNIITPCVIIDAIQRDRDPQVLAEMGISIAVGAGTILLGTALTALLFRRKPAEERRVLRFAMSYPNSGYMGIPLVQAVLGDGAVLYAASFVIAFNVVLWTFGVRLMGGRKEVSLRSALVNPGTVSFAIGLVLFALNWTLPGPLGGAVTLFAGMNTPIAMLAIGVFIAFTDLRQCFRRAELYGACAVRMIVIPAAVLLVLRVLPLPNPSMTTALIICASAPTAAATSMFASRYRLDTGLASQLVTLCTLLSIATMPVFAALAQAA